MIKELIFFPLIISFLISFASTPLVIFIYKKLNWLQKPGLQAKDTHTYPVPRGGGIALWLAIFLSSLFFLPPDKHLLGILGGATLLAITGVLDDKFDLNPYLRLIIGFLAAGLVVGAGIGISFITNPFDGIIKLDQPQISFYFLGKQRSIWVLADVFALVWIVFLTNIVNWAKGFDGQLPGIVTIAALTIAVLALKFSADITQWPVAILASITAGAYLGFLPFNFYPQKIMPGYGGGALAGFMLAVLAILSTTKVGTALVVLGIPVVDAFWSILRRIASGRSPVWGDRGHLHHKILDEWKWSKRKAAVFYWLVTAFLGILALNLPSLFKFYTIILVILVVGGLLLWFNYLSTFSKRSDQDKPLKT